MNSNINIPSNPTVIKWIRESSGYKIEDISKKLGVSTDLVKSWEEKSDSLALKYANRLAVYFKRPLATFLLSKPLDDVPIPRSFRILPGETEKLSTKTFLSLRRARRYQEIAADIIDQAGFAPKSHVNKYDVSHSVDNVAKKEREFLGANMGDQFRKWKNASNALKAWRDILEERNIFVFQFNFPLEDGRGFCLIDKEPFVIVLNSQDSPEARIFTLFHEYAHILLRSEEEAFFETHHPIRKSGTELEAWCNKFAASFLMPKGNIQFELTKLSENKSSFYKEIKKISNRYKVSNQALLIRMVSLGLISSNELNSILGKVPRKIKAKGFAKTTAKERLLHEKGKRFVSLVLTGNKQGKISTRDASDYLSIKPKNLKDINSYDKK